MQSTVKEHDNLELQQSLQATEVFLSLILPLDVEYPSLGCRVSEFETVAQPRKVAGLYVCSVAQCYGRIQQRYCTKIRTVRARLPTKSMKDIQPYKQLQSPERPAILQRHMNYNRQCYFESNNDKRSSRLQLRICRRTRLEKRTP